MQLTRALYRNSNLLFVVFSGLVLWGFGNTYFANPLQFSGAMQLHGLSMTLWCVMLVTQAYLIRTNRRSLHKLIGKTSYVLAPVVVAAQLAIISSGLTKIDQFRPEGLFFTQQGITAHGLEFAASVGMTAVFAFAYGMAILNRKTPATHGRWMICTPLPMLAPATDRIIGKYFDSILEYFPRYPGVDMPYVMLQAFLIADVILVVLAVWDWRSHKRLNVFPVMLAAMFAFQAFHYNAASIPVWEAMCNWYMGLPIG